MNRSYSYSLQSQEVSYLARKDSVLAALIQTVGPLEYETYTDYFSFIIFTIISQMLSNKIGDVLFERLAQMCKGKIDAESLNNLSENELTKTGISKRKARAIKAISEKTIEDASFLKNMENMDNQSIINSLTRFQGIGKWTAKMFLIFCLNRLDVLPIEDGAFVAAYSLVYGYIDKTRDKRGIMQRCKKWGPYSSIAARYLYKAYDTILKE